MARGKNIQLYLMDGDVNGRIKCTLANWTGLAFKIPRTALDLCKDRPELKQTGVYLLFGKDENDKSVVYIGQAGVRKNGEGILNRLVEHNRNSKKDYWTEAIALTTSNDSLGPTEISYLEHQFSSGYWTKKNMGKDVSNEIVEFSGLEDTEISLITKDAVVKRIRKAKAEVVEKVHTDVTEELDVAVEEDLSQKKMENICWG